MRPSKKRSSAFLTALLCAVALIMVACGGGGSTSTPTTSHAKAPASQQVFIEGYTGSGIADFGSLDPALLQTLNDAQASNIIFTGMIELNDQGVTYCELCTTYSMASDGVTWTFHLRSGLKFSDGTPLTSADVVYSINRALLPATKSVVAPTYLALIKDSDKLNTGKISTIIGDSLLTPDPNTVVIIANKKAAYFLDALVYSTSYVVEKSLIDKYGLNFTDHLNEGGGDGPFEVQSWNHGTNIVLVPNPYYYGPKPQLTKLIYPFYKQSDTNFKAYQAGQTDFAFNIPTADLATAQA